MDTSILRESFKNYLQKRFPNDNHVSVTVSMAFFLERYGYEFGINFQQLLASGDIPDVYRLKLEKHFANNGRKDPRGNASIYVRSLRLLIEYVNERAFATDTQRTSASTPKNSTQGPPAVVLKSSESMDEAYIAKKELFGHKAQEDVLNLLHVLKSLCRKRSVFHSEADFQFALAWEIQLLIPTAEIRLEYPPEGEPNKYIDILVRNEGSVFPIELKYKTRKLSVFVDSEQYNLKTTGRKTSGPMTSLRISAV